MKMQDVNNSTFIESREKEWIKFARIYVWIAVSITPFNISDNIIEPQNPNLSESIHTLKQFPVSGYDSSYVNSIQNSPRLDEDGLINKNLDYIHDSSLGHRIKIFRNGHCEFLLCLERSVQQTSQILDLNNDYNLEIIPGTKCLNYDDFAKAFIYQIEALLNIWNASLPFSDMLLTTMITNTTDVNMTVKLTPNSITNDYKFGIPVNSTDSTSLKSLKYSRNISKSSLDTIKYDVIKRFINNFNWDIDELLNEKGELNRPHLFSKVR
ncbi:hypothetical protein [Dolichospermum circinale]|uniref:hypothetical protein n=1 Tax=Dolichospermum circinale TaxID=109265 RepID=UPI00232D1EBD|nr:hypothetical protein [Dolichospermum circinale]MDB9452517.1 hypothetical protein [Dolichospermum circinale CS-547]